MVDNPFYRAWQSGQPPPPGNFGTENASGTYGNVTFNMKEAFDSSLDEGTERARDSMVDGHVVMEAFSQQELQADGTQKEVWYVP